jgi:DNA replication protein DnaC
MINPELAEWRDKFLRNTGLELDLSSDPGGFYDETLRLTEERVPARFARALATHPDLLAWMAAAVYQAPPRGLGLGPSESVLLLGPTGTGKTWESFGVVRGFAACGLRVKWRHVTQADYYALLRPRHGIDPEEEFRGVAGARFLIMDDLGAAKESEWTEEALFRLVDYRYREVLPTVFTSNLLPVAPKRKPGAPEGPPSLPSVLGERVTSRITEMAVQVDPLDGPDRRMGTA